MYLKICFIQLWWGSRCYTDKSENYIDRIYVSIYIQVVPINCKADLNLKLVKDIALQSHKEKVAEPKVQLYKVYHMPLLMGFR